MNASQQGRKLFDGKDENLVLLKLEQAFTVCATDEEACVLADISPSALYAYQKKHKGFLERKQALKNLPTLRAKMTIVSRLENDVGLAKWWLAKKLPLEFGDQNEKSPITIGIIDLTSKSAETAAKYDCEDL